MRSMYSRSAGPVAAAGDVARDVDIAFGSQRGQQIEFLEDEADFAICACACAPIGQRGEVDAVDQHTSGVGVRQAAQDVEQRRLAAARGADDADELTLLHLRAKPRAMPAHPLCRCGRFCAHPQLESSTPCESLILHETITLPVAPGCAGAAVPATRRILPTAAFSRYNSIMPRTSSEMKHAQLVARAAEWLRHKYGCGIVLSEQYCATGEVPDVIGWKGFCQSVLVECKVSRSDFLADAGKPFRLHPEEGLGSKRFYMAPRGHDRARRTAEALGIAGVQRPRGGDGGEAGKLDLRSPVGLMKEMNLLLASLRRVEVRIEPQTITDF